MLGSNRPRRFASSTDAVMSRSSSLSVRYLTAFGRTMGSTCLFEAVSVAASVAETRLVGGGEASEPYRSKTDRVLLGECGHAPWWQDRGSITPGIPRCGARRIEVFRRANRIHVFQWWAETFLTHSERRSPGAELLTSPRLRMPTIRLLLLITANLRTFSASMCRTALARSSSSRQQ